MSRSQRSFPVSFISGPGRRSRALPMPLSGSRPRADRLKRSIRDWLPDAVRSRPLSRRRARAPDRSRSARHGKLHRLTDLIRQQADHYGFSTFPRREIDISLKISVRKRKASRSDLSYPPVTIRLKWAYHLALMELSRTVSTNHPGSPLRRSAAGSGPATPRRLGKAAARFGSSPRLCGLAPVRFGGVALRRRRWRAAQNRSFKSVFTVIRVACTVPCWWKRKFPVGS